MTRGLFERKRPVQEKLGRLKKVILRDVLNREKSAKELADNYGVSYGSLLIYFKRNGIKKRKKNSSGIRHRSKIEDVRNYIKENNITKRQVELAVLSVCKDLRKEKARR